MNIFDFTRCIDLYTFSSICFQLSNSDLCTKDIRLVSLFYHLIYNFFGLNKNIIYIIII